MFSRVIRFTAIILLIALTIYLVIANASSVSLVLSPNLTLETPLGVVLVGAFLAGIVTASAVSFLASLRRAVRDRAMRAAHERERKDFEKLLDARAALVSGDLRKARILLERIVKTEPHNLLARLELVSCYEGLNEMDNALSLLDETRTRFPKRIEVLARAAELNEKAGNKTAALDNYQLIIAAAPTRQAVERAMNLAEELGHYGDALDFYNMLGNYEAQDPRDGARIAFKRITNWDNAAPEVLRDKLTALTKTFPQAVEANQYLATLLAREGRIKEAAQQMVKAAKAAGTPEAWHALTLFWLEHKQPENALSAARTAIAEVSREHRVAAELILAKLYLDLGRYEEADRLLNQIEQSLAQTRLQNGSGEKVRARLLAFRAISALNSQNTREASSLISELDSTLTTGAVC